LAPSTVADMRNVFVYNTEGWTSYWVTVAP